LRHGRRGRVGGRKLPEEIDGLGRER
jgi:hypothetical protein